MCHWRPVSGFGIVSVTPSQHRPDVLPPRRGLLHVALDPCLSLLQVGGTESTDLRQSFPEITVLVEAASETHGCSCKCRSACAATSSQSRRSPAPAPPTTCASARNCRTSLGVFRSRGRPAPLGLRSTRPCTTTSPRPCSRLRCKCHRSPCPPRSDAN